MLSAALLSVCSASLAPPQALTVKVDPVVVVRGRPVRLSATLTYHGAGRAEISSDSLHWPCAYAPPPDWRRLPPGPPVVSLKVGGRTSLVYPGQRITHTIDVGRVYDVDVPPGRYTVRVQGVLNLAPGGQLHSAPVDVPVLVVAEGANEVDTDPRR